MRILYLLLVAVSAWAADAPRIIFTKSFAGSLPPFFSITVERTGMASYNETNDADNEENIQLEPNVAAEIFALADKLDHFKKPLESGLKVANMGQKTLRWEDGGQTTEATFNYSTVEDAKALNDWFEKIGESVRVLLDLRRAAKYDKLGVNASVVTIQALWDNKRLVGTPQFLPLLDQVAKNEAYIHMARERAAQIASAIRAASSQ
jgi:hypothetical protein